MSDDQLASLVWSLGALVLVVSGYAARRMPTRSTFKLAGIWIAIFAVAFALIVILRRDAL